MTEELKALYHASLLSASHAVFYRLPHGKMFHGAVSSNLSDASNDSEGFILSNFDKNGKPKLIQNQIDFKFDDALELNYNVKNSFTAGFQEHFNECLNTPASGYTPCYNLHPINFSTQAEYINNVKKAQLEIKKGAFEKVVLSRAANTKKQHIMDIFTTLCIEYPSAFVSLISSPFYGTWLGASPEILLEQSHENYATVAVAGTKKASSKTLFTTKEFEEQNIITKYIESYLSSQQIKSVSSKIEDLNAGTLTHLKTNITFTLSPHQRLDILQGLHPTPAVGGYPTENAVKFIKENENYSREIYAGYMGPILKNEMHAFVNIRCMQWFPDYAVVYAGAGITGASNAEAEWVETENKMQIIASVL
jgi:isochorismate synthase